MTSPHRESNDDNIPLAYFITFRAYGTWLHGDERGSVDRLHNTFGSPSLRLMSAVATAPGSVSAVQHSLGRSPYLERVRLSAVATAPGSVDWFML